MKRGGRAVEGARLESAYTEQFVSRVRIPSSLLTLIQNYNLQGCCIDWD